MSTLDWIIIAVVGIGVWRGFRAGLAREIVGTVGLVFAFLVSVALMAPVGRMITSALAVSEQVAPVLGFVAVFVVVNGGLSLAGYVFRTTLHTVRLGLLESAGGGAVGGLKAAFFLSVILLATSIVPQTGGEGWFFPRETRSSSSLYGAIEPLAPAAWDVLMAVAPGIQEAAREKFRAAEPFLPGD